MEKHIILDQKLKKEEEFIGNKMEDFETLQTLGKGSYGFVAKVKSKINQKIYALKMIDFSLINDNKEKQLAMNEIEIIKTLNNPHIIKYYKSFQEGNKFYIIMEYINNGDIKGYINACKSMNTPIPEKEIWEFFYQSMSGLCHIHRNKIIHRDIKPANLFLTDNKTIKIGDFGVSATRSRKENITITNPEGTQALTRETMMIGTPLYMSPEMFRQEKYGSKVDVYAMGCTFYEMCFFSPPRMPTPSMSPQGEIITYLQDVEPNANKGFYSQDVIDLLNKMIERDENKRLNSDRVFEFIRTKYNNITRQNSSIFCVYKCLFTFDSLINRLIKYKLNPNEEPISSSFLLAYNNRNNNNFTFIINQLRNILTYYNSSFEDPGEIEPVELIHFILEQIHIENNKTHIKYARLYTMENDNDIFNGEKIFKKYSKYFKDCFRSCISDNFFGTFKIKKKCLNCKRERYYFESFYYLKVDANEVMKYYSLNNNNNNFFNNNFILECFKKEFGNKILTETNCPLCKSKQLHEENKTIIVIPSNLIISLESEDPNINTQNLKIPFILNLTSINLLKNYKEYKLKGIIKKNVLNGQKFFASIYTDNDKMSWILSDGYSYKPLNSFLEHNSGNIIMLFYSSNN